MAWNEPGNNNNGHGPDKDPWKKNQGNRHDQGPPDLDELMSKLNRKIAGKMGGQGNPFKSGTGFGLIACILAGIWGVSGLYTVGEAERGVALRLGKYHRIVEPGLNWRPPFIDEVTQVNVRSIRSLRTSGLMLTKDENVVTVEMGVQYRVSDPHHYLYSVTNADDSLRQATDSSLRAVIGDAVMDDILTSGRSAIRQKTQEVLNQIIGRYEMGIEVVDVNFQAARPPEQVKDAFDDAIAAREDQERFIRKAEAYRNEILPQAKGTAERLKKEAQSYSERVVNAALGEVAQFEKLLPEYRNAPSITKERMYLEAMESVYSQTSKVLIDTKGNGSVFYLPLDKVIKQHNAKMAARPGENSQAKYREIENRPVSTTQSNSYPSSRSQVTRQGRY